jgi:hypothetical protein
VLTGSTRRCLTSQLILTLDPERRENRKATIGQENLSNGLDLRLTLKLLVASHILRRNTLPSSKVLA